MAEKINGGTSQGPPSGEKMTKIKAVELSLAKLGKNAMPKEIQADIKERFDMDVAADYVGKIKSELLNKKKKAAKPAGKEQATAVEKPVSARGKTGNAQSVEIGDILELKRLVERVGADDLKTLIDVMDG